MLLLLGATAADGYQPPGMYPTRLRLFPEIDSTAIALRSPRVTYRVVPSGDNASPVGVEVPGMLCSDDGRSRIEPTRRSFAVLITETVSLPALATYNSD